MSRKSAPAPPKSAPRQRRKALPKDDLRIRRTRDRLGGALVNLMHEKPFEEITVQHVLDRAGISRSTFYTHYRDKNDLFLGDVESFLELVANALTARGDKSNRVAPVREFFAHVAEMKHFYTAIVEAGKLHDVTEMGQESFARGIEVRLAFAGYGRTMTPTQRAIVAHGFAGALFSMLSWWISRGMKMPPEEVDEAFHRLVWSGVGATDPQELSTASRAK